MCKIYTFCSIFTLFAFSAFSQENPDLQTLLNQREQLIQQQVSLISIEKEIANTGTFPPAYVTQITVNQSIQLQFECYKTISEERQSVYEQRFQALFPEIESISIQNQLVIVQFPNSTTLERKNEFFTVFGYAGFTLSNP